MLFEVFLLISVFFFLELRKYFFPR